MTSHTVIPSNGLKHLLNHSLKEVLIRHPLTVTLETPLKDVIQQMSQVQECLLSGNQSSPHSCLGDQTHTSCVLVMEGQQLVGILTRLDVIKLIGSETGWQGVKVARIMTQLPIVLRESDAQDLSTVVQLFRQHHIYHLPIVNDHEQLLGIVTPESIRQLLQPVHLLQRQRVAEMMTTEVPYAPATASVQHLTRLMAEYETSCVVITQEKGTPHTQFLIPTGIVTEQDILQLQALKLDLGKLQAYRVMSSPLVYLSPQDSFWRAEQQMLEQQVQQLVVYEPQEELVGIITKNSWLKAINAQQMYHTIELLQQEVEQLQAEKVELIDQHHTELEEIAIQQSTIKQTQITVGEYQQTEQELQKANQALHRSFATNRALLNAIPDLILRLSREGKLVNYKAAKDFQIPFHPCQFLGKSLYDMFPREVAELAMACVQQSLSTGETQSFEYQLSWDNQCRFYEARFAVSDIDEVIVIVRDITERKQAETELIDKSNALANFSSNLKRLHRLSTTNYQDIEYLFADYLQTGCEIFGLPTGMISKITQKSYYIRSIISDSESLVPYLFRNLKKTYCALSYKEKKTISYNNISIGKTRKQRSGFNLRLNSYICTPIFVNHEIYGTLSFSSTQPRSSNFRTDEQEMIELMAQSIGKFIATNQMVIEQQHAEEALRESEQRFRQMAENIRQVFWMRDPRLEQMIYISPAYEEIWGHSCQSMYQNPQSFLESVHPEDRNRVIAALKQQKQGEYDVEYRILQLGGQERWIRDQAFPIYDSEGGIDRLVGIAEDITEYKLAEQKMRQALEQEKELNELKSRFVSMTSHEFRTPLATILSSTELLQHYNHKWTEHKKEVHFERICSTVQHMTQMLDDVLFWSKIDAKKSKLQPSWLDIISFCRSLVEELQQSQGKEHNIIFQCSSQDCVRDHQLLGTNCCRVICDNTNSCMIASLTPMHHNSNDYTSAVTVSELPQWLVCLDQKLLRHILINLLSNAIKYSPTSSTIELEVVFDQGNVIFQIQDHGIGIPPEDLPHLFESFHRSENVGNIPGTGLGLAIVQKSVELHGGQITVNSKAGIGTIFTVTIPGNVCFRQ
ncbi:MAG: CBS domain-containing protein [Symploca sp. SIO2E6]|nr:CBS domain-containing protein [Symploca sp. SIO2E6]